MQEQISLKQAEQKVFKTAVNDGLWDILVGGFLLQFAVAPLLSTSLGDFWSSAVFIPFWGMLFLLIWLLRKYVVAPRIGTVKFGPARRRELSKFTIVMLIMNLIAFFAGLYFAFNAEFKSGWTVAATFAVPVLLMSSAAAYFLNINRIFIYGLLTVLAFFIGEWSFVTYQTAHHGFPITFGTLSIAVFATGVTIFTRLLKNNPLPEIDNNLREGV